MTYISFPESFFYGPKSIVCQPSGKSDSTGPPCCPESKAIQGLMPG